MAQAPPPNLDPALKSPLWRLLARNRLTRVARAARHVTRPLSFAVVELLRRDGAPRLWRIRGTRDPVALRAGTADFDIFEEVFRARTYDPVPEVRAALDALDRPLVVADIGANIGLFTIWALGEFPVDDVRLVEPDPASLELLRIALAASRRPNGTFDVHPAAAGTAPGRSAFHAGGFQMSRLGRPDELGSPDVIEVPVVDALPLMFDADLVKLDIEGAEWPILADERLEQTSVSALVLEYHRVEGGPDGYLPDAAARLLEEKGFAVRQLFWNPPYVGQLWAWRNPPAAR